MAAGQVDYKFLTDFVPKIIDVADRSGAFWVRQRYLIERSLTELHVVAYVRGGSGSLQLDSGQPVSLQTGTVFQIGTGRSMRLETSPRDPLAFHSIQFRYSLIDWHGATPRLRPGGSDFLLQTDAVRLDDALLEEEFRQTLEAWTGRTPGYEWRAQLGLLRVAHRMCQVLDVPSAADSGESSAIALAVDYIKHHLHLPLERSDVATRVGLSPGYFSTLFKRRTGQGFSQYVRGLRLDEAKRLLTESELPVREIAARVGFADPFYFSRVFKDVVGLSPQHYRMP